MNQRTKLLARAAFLAAVAICGRATAEPALPQLVKAAMEQTTRDCSSLQKAEFQRGFVTERDVNGDGIKDYILDYGKFACDGNSTLYCGSGGCVTEVIASLPGGRYGSVYNDNVRGMTFARVKGRPAMLLELHGSACGRVGADECKKTLYWNGRSFAPPR